MLKYRFEIRQGRLRAAKPLLTAGIIVLVINSASTMFWSYFDAALPTILTSLVILIAAICFFRNVFSPQRRTPRPAFILFDGRDAWYLCDWEDQLTEQPPWYLTRGARIIPLGVYLDFVDADGQHHYQWILRDELPEGDYRRLVRTTSMLTQREPDVQL